MEPLEAWRRLGYRQRMDVLPHARQGRPHPDPEMAATAVGWARWWRAQPLSRHVLSALGFTLKLYALLALALLATLLTGGTASIEPGSTILGSVAGGLLTTAAIIAARVLWVRADAAKVERVHAGIPLSGTMR